MAGENLHYLLTGYKENRLTDSERRQLLDIISLADETLKRRLDELLASDETIDAPATRDYLFQVILSNKETAKNTPVVHRIHFLRTAWFRYAAAIILIAGIGAYLWNQPPASPQNNIVITENKQDIAPGNDKAILTLSDGRKIELNQTVSETINDGMLSIKNENGQLTYGKGEAATINTMTTPKGGQYRLTLPDGTRVWLNAASSITYPTAFTDNKREVNLTGEAYFEVKANKDQPFIVNTGKDKIQVIGTSFNVFAYPDEPVAKTSLIEGAVKINGVLLKPGEAYKNGKLNKTDIAQDIAWRNGEINFEDKTIEQLMREIGRWYNLDVSYKKTPPAIRFFGSVKRNVSLMTVLKVLERSGMKFRLDDKKLIVL